MAKRKGSDDLDITVSKKNSQTIPELKKRCTELGIKTRSKDGKEEFQKLLKYYDEIEGKSVEELQKQGASMGLGITRNMKKHTLIQSIVNAKKMREDIDSSSMNEIQTQLGKYFLSSTGKKEEIVQRLYQRELIVYNYELTLEMENSKKTAQEKGLIMKLDNLDDIY